MLPEIATKPSFPDADRFDVRRVNARMHLGFGQGEHFCIGGALARLEARVAFEILLTRMQNIRLAAGKNDFAHTPSFILRGLKKLHLEFDACLSPIERWTAEPLSAKKIICSENI